MIASVVTFRLSILMIRIDSSIKEFVLKDDKKVMQYCNSIGTYLPRYCTAGRS